MHTYRELFQVPEFRPLFLSVCAGMAASTLRGLALATLVYSATGSPLLSALSLFGSHFAQVIGALTLLSVADRMPPRVAMVALAVIQAVGTLALALPGMPVWGLFVVIGVMGLVGSVGGGVRWGLLGEITPGDDYILARSVFNMSVGAMQISGFALGGLLLTLTTPRVVLVMAAALCLAAALVARFGLLRRPPRATGRPSVGETWRVNVLLWSGPARRYAYLAAWVPNGLVVGCEALFVPYDPDAAAVLFVAGALGMLTGDTVMGRFVRPEWRKRLLTPMQLLLGVPYLLFALSPALPLAALAVAAASAGFSGGLLLQQRIVALTPQEVRGQALGLHSAGMLTMQAVGASVAGFVAQYVSTGNAMVVMGLLSITIALTLRPGLRATAADRVLTTSPV
ncbi:putative MFS family arabinose efflux permease [Micromonospora pisi]|uniref:Putative MFS family arabinose efflux permease n=1 Tax=Micromonospora pisi TaxID=589240 RepID=A0A495JDD2_9ACTN|nr:MFS transporter [Micromonospora pisi]RKR86362.1 putative MFS family arabinose efflux permease [Micromonospora pisi]